MRDLPYADPPPRSSWSHVCGGGPTLPSLDPDGICCETAAYSDGRAGWAAQSRIRHPETRRAER